MTKKRSKDSRVLKAERKVESEVFDRSTLQVLSKLIKKGILQSVDFPVSTGKEANVFRATTPEGSYLAVKIYKIETSFFFRRSEYLEGDPRFKKIKNNELDIAMAFARKEFKNLQICENAGVHSPKPIFVDKNVIVMTFIGEGELPYPTMNILGPTKESELDSIISDMKKMYFAGLVHTDLSEYNVLLAKDAPYLIDFGQAVVTRHPRAKEFLERDVRNILHYFAKFGYKKDFDETMSYISSP